MSLAHTQEPCTLRHAAVQAIRGAAPWAGDEEEDSPPDLDETEREAWLLRVTAAAVRAMDAQRMGALEISMLSLRAAQEAAGEGQSALPATSPATIPADLAAAAADLLRPERGRLAAGVFRPGHNLPTMSVEQWGEREMVRMAEQQKRAAAAAAAEGEGEDERDENGEGDAEALKQRKWDDWKDDHPFGSGNSRLRPCPSGK